MPTTIGIDLGTTNSCAAYVRDGKPEIIMTSDFTRTIPSVVSTNDDGEIVVGKTAKQHSVVRPDSTVSSIKREMGSRYRANIGGKAYMPQSVSAFILQRLKTDAENFLGGAVTDAVITVPAYFTDAQRQATKDAGRIAGLNVRRIINEPTAAALAYGIDQNETQNVLVYDLGGGTFDVSVLSIDEGMVEVLATAGNNRLGGDDFDRALMGYLIGKFKQDNGVDLDSDSFAKQRLIEASEAAKIALTDEQETEVFLPFIHMEMDSHKHKVFYHLKETVTRAQFDEMIADYVDETLDAVKRALMDSGLEKGEVDKLVLVGGSTRVPLVRETIQSWLGLKAEEGVNPDECVAIGAALQAAVLSGEVDDMLLLDVTPLSLGVESLNDVCVRVIERNTRIPCKRSRTFTTVNDFQTTASFHILQGESAVASQNKELGVLELDQIRRALHGNLIMEVTFRIDTDGIVHVSALNTETGHEREIDIVDAMNVSSEEVDAIIRETAIKENFDPWIKQIERNRTAAYNCINEGRKQAMFMTGDDRKFLSEAVKRCAKATNRRDDDRDEDEAAATAKSLWSMLATIDVRNREDVRMRF